VTNSSRKINRNRNSRMDDENGFNRRRLFFSHIIIIIIISDRGLGLEVLVSSAA
jgi:hypothetical protein